jgi:CBS domain-containing protein
VGLQQQTISENKTIKTIIMAMGGVLKQTKVQELVQHKGRLVEVPYTATVGDALNALLAKNILAVPVAASPGQWVGAGGSMIMEADKSTGQMRKQYIGMVSVLDILIHIVEEEGGEDDFAGRLSSTVASVIGHSLEGLSLWTVSPNASIYEVMEPMSKGIHRALVPVESLMHQPHHAPVEIMESSPAYQMLTQTDMVRFLLVHAKDLEFVTGLSVSTLGLMQTSVFAAPSNMKVMDVVKCMRNVSLAAVAIVENSPDIIPDDPMLVIVSIPFSFPLTG